MSLLIGPGRVTRPARPNRPTMQPSGPNTGTLQVVNPPNRPNNPTAGAGQMTPPGMDPGVYTAFTGTLDPNIQGAMNAGVNAYGAGVGQNQGIIDRLMGRLDTLGTGINSLTGGYANTLQSGVNANNQRLQGIYNDIAGSLGTNPYTDQMRESNLAGMNNQITGDVQSAQNQLKRGAAASGIGGSLAAGANAQIQGAGIGARAGAINQSMMDQLGFNQQANLARGGLLGQLGLGQGSQGLTGFGMQGDATQMQVNPQLTMAGMGQQAGLMGLTDPMAIPGMIGGAFGTQISQDNANAMLQFAQQQQQQQQPNLFDLGSLLFGMSPNPMMQGISTGFNTFRNIPWAQNNNPFANVNYG